ncbi:hypothetical protein RSOL_439180 [Rhizoctonia solani AG-3 Rhs1AP]|uniref:Uncharacterized protein n=1 Tax=Rhizoctonia solani AG-3 Rhs1AP TaxID=1086054 RepID=X8JMY1_9AGAM|nr:hypothetical protein RSOL_439180 [Rhizoctonia solani AG-3 Rhs1AP]
MSSDYDYDDEDLLLNDDDIRKLSEVEDKCGVVAPITGLPNAVSSSTIPKRGENPPPQKRAKVVQPVPASQSDDDTPDIFVNADGTYAFDSPGPSVLSLAPSFIHPSTSRRVVSESVPPRSVSPPAAHSRPSNHSGGEQFAARPLRRHDSSASIQVIEIPPATQGLRPLIRAGSLSQAISRGLVRNGVPLTQQQSQSQMQIDNGLRDPGAKRLQTEVQVLRDQLAKAESERQSLRASLQQNKEATFAKVGEAENLRRTMSKQTEQHAEEMARLRQEMVEMEKARVALEAQMKLEVDRARNDATFTKDPTHRGFPNVNSTIKKRQVMGSSHTPGSTQALSRAAELQSSPLSPTKRPIRRTMGPPAPPLEKGFNNLTNSFTRSTSPLKTRVRSRPLVEGSFNNHQDNSIWSGLNRFQDKGKGKSSTTWPDSEEHSAGPARGLNFEEPESWRTFPIPATQAPFAMEPDVFGASSLPKTPKKRRDEANLSMEVIEPVDLVDELRMLLLAHVILFGSLETPKTFSLQTVLTASVPDNLRQRFDTACTSLFNAFSGSTALLTGEKGENGSVWDHSAQKASLALAQLAQVFQEAGLFEPLHVLVNLLTSVSAVIPAFARWLLAAGTKDHDSLILEVLCDTFVKFFKKPLESGGVWHLAEGMLGLCEALASQAKDDCVIRFSILSRRAEVLPVLLDLAQPPPWTVRVTRLLGILGSKPSLARALLSFPDIHPPVTRELAKVPLIESLCRHLTAFRKHNLSEHYRELYENILITFAQLAIADSQSLVTLVDSPSLLLSLVSFIYHVTSAIWSEVALAEYAPGNHETSLVQNLQSAVQLLHYLVFSADPAPNVRERLLYATRGPFNGSIHFFIVSFGRLAFGDPPEYLDADCSKAIRGIRGLSETLLETVVDGPEVDGIYAVFRDSDEDEVIPSSVEKVDASVADEEEEALHMAIDDYY